VRVGELSRTTPQVVSHEAKSNCRSLDVAKKLEDDRSKQSGQGKKRRRLRGKPNANVGE
jgi:hypothetical protein